MRESENSVAAGVADDAIESAVVNVPLPDLRSCTM
jgi:hypothetical protein